MGDDAEAPDRSPTSVVQHGLTLHELAEFDAAASVDEHVTEIENPVEPTSGSNTSDGLCQLNGELLLQRLSLSSRRPPSASEVPLDTVKISLENTQRQRHHADDRAGGAIESSGERSCDANLVEADYLRAERFEWGHPRPCAYLWLPIYDLNHISLKGIFAIHSVEKFEPVHTGFDQVGRHAGRAGVKLIGDQNTA